MRQGERCASFHALLLPVEWIDELLDDDVGGVAEPLEVAVQVVAGLGAHVDPVDLAVEVWCGLEHVEGMGADRRHGGLVQRGHAHQQRRVGHPHAVAEDRAEAPVPVLAEVDVVVLGPGWECAAHTDVPHEGGR